MVINLSIKSIAVLALVLSVAPGVAQGPAANSVAAAIENAKKAQQAAEAKRAVAERAAKTRAQQRARVEAKRKEYEQNELAARQNAIRRAEQERRNEQAREATAQAQRDARDAARRQALLEAQQRSEELRRIAQLNADNLRADLEQKAKGGDASAAMSLARIYETGDGVSPSATIARSWLKTAADLGDTTAQLIYVKTVVSEPGVGTDPLVLKYLMSLSAQNNSEAQYLLSQRYASAMGVPQDKAKALTLLKSAADAGYIEAQGALGKALQDGGLGKKDYKLSITYLQSAATQGSVSASYNLGFAYENGWGVRKEPELAYQYYLQVYRNGRVDGIVNRLKAVDEFNYAGKDYSIVPSQKLEMNCPSMNVDVKFEDGYIKENFAGAYTEHSSLSFKKQKGRNVFKYGLIVGTIVDFDQRKYILSAFGKKVAQCN